MRYLAVFFLIVFGSFPCFAQNSEQYSACNDKAKTQTEMTACANEEAVRADSELNGVYNKLLSKTASQAEALEKIKAAERAWIVYRDAYIEAMYPSKNKLAEYGSSYPMDVVLLRAKLTKEQTAALKDLMQ